MLPLRAISGARSCYATGRTVAMVINSGKSENGLRGETTTDVKWKAEETVKNIRNTGM